MFDIIENVNIFGWLLLHWYFLHNFVTLYFMVNLLFKCRKFALIASFSMATSILGTSADGRELLSCKKIKKMRIIYARQFLPPSSSNYPPFHFIIIKWKFMEMLKSWVRKVLRAVVSNAVHIQAINLIKHANKLMYELPRRWMFLVEMPAWLVLMPNQNIYAKISNICEYIIPGNRHTKQIWCMLRLRNLNLWNNSK